MTAPDITLDPSQERAVELVLRAPFGVVTGGPGTGKTTILRTALDRLDAIEAATPKPARGAMRAKIRGAFDENRADPFGRREEALADAMLDAGDREEWRPYALAAPTGKAARRMAEATRRETSTIHRLLGYGQGQDGGEFFRNAQNPIPASLVVVDEASMVDVEVASALFRAVDPGRTRLVLVGDANQLPSVGPGRLLADLVESGEVPVAKLEVLHRAAASSWICRSAPRVLRGEMPELGTTADFEFRAVTTREGAGAAILELVIRELPGRGIHAAQVLVPQNTGPAGGDTLNARLQAALNPRREGEAVYPRSKSADAGELRPRDRVIQTKNDYFRAVMNGETGVVVAADAKRVSVRFEGRDSLVDYEGSAALALRLAYALTVHKSQGSEWPWVVVLAHSTHTFMLSRRLLYTALTRAKAGVVLVGDRAGLDAALANVRDADRYTGLVARFRARRGAQEGIAP